MRREGQKKIVKAVDCFIALGSNKGNRISRLKQAISDIDKLPGVKVLKKSRVYQTQPLGPSRRDFLNCALKIRTTRTALGLLIEFKRLEFLSGRKPGKRWGPRPLDIDLIAYGNARIKTPWLTVPHPEAAKRAFVLVPLSEIAPRIKLGSRATVQEALSRLKDISGTVKLFS